MSEYFPYLACTFVFIHAPDHSLASTSIKLCVYMTFKTSFLQCSSVCRQTPKSLPLRLNSTSATAYSFFHATALSRTQRSVSQPVWMLNSFPCQPNSPDDSGHFAFHSAVAVADIAREDARVQTELLVVHEVVKTTSQHDLISMRKSYKMYLTNVAPHVASLPPSVVQPSADIEDHKGARDPGGRQARGGAESPERPSRKLGSPQRKYRLNSLENRD